MDSVRLVLSDLAMEQLLQFCTISAIRNEPARLRLRETPRDLTKHDKANLMMRSVLITRLQLRLSVAQLSRFAPYKVTIPLEQALALMAEWTGPISDAERALLSVAEVVGTIDAATA